MIFASVPVLESPEALGASWSHWVGCHEELLIVDNTTEGLWADLAKKQGWSYFSFWKNLGVPSAWNIARAWFMARTERDHDMLLLMSASVEWSDGLPAVLDDLTTAANWKGCQTQWGPHAIAWSRKVFELVGTFDESFWPGYSSDTDWFYRCILEGILVSGPDAMPSIETNSPKPPDARAANRLGLAKNHRAGTDLFAAKWGGTSGHETFTSPFGSGLPSWWWTPCFRPGAMSQVNLGESVYR